MAASATLIRYSFESTTQLTQLVISITNRQSVSVGIQKLCWEEDADPFKSFVTGFASLMLDRFRSLQKNSSNLLLLLNYGAGPLPGLVGPSRNFSSNLCHPVTRQGF